MEKKYRFIIYSAISVMIFLVMVVFVNNPDIYPTIPDSPEFEDTVTIIPAPTENNTKNFFIEVSDDPGFG